MSINRKQIITALAGLFIVSGAANALAADTNAPVGAVYVLSNSAARNSVYVYDRFADGSLVIRANVPTGGLGTGGGLGSEGAVQLSPDKKWLVAANAGSDDVSLFQVRKSGLKLVSRFASRGDMPTSVTVFSNWIYVLNAGSSEIAGFQVQEDGSVEAMGETAPLSARNAGGAQVRFSPAGDMLVVTEKATNAISTYGVDWSGRIMGRNVWQSSGPTPFGFAFGNRSQLFVAEANGGAAHAGTVSSYRTNELNSAMPATASLFTAQSAPCWTVTSPDGRLVYTANTPNDTITGFRVGRDGTLSMVDASGVSAALPKGNVPVDMAISSDNRFLYVLTRGKQTITSYEIMPSGKIRKLATTVGLPTSAFGLDGF